MKNINNKYFQRFYQLITIPPDPNEHFKYTKPSGFGVISDWINRHGILFNIPLALLLCFLMELISRRSFPDTIDFVVNHFAPYLYNSYILFACMSFCFLIAHRVSYRFLLFGLFILLAVLNCIILMSRVTPFGFVDIYMIFDLLTMQGTSYFTPDQGAMCVVGISIFFILCIVILIKEKPYKSKFRFPFRLAVYALVMGSIPLVTSILLSCNVLSGYFGNLAQGYKDYGYLYGFSMSVFNTGMSKPGNYTPDRVDSILAENDMGQSGIDAKDGPNVVVVLLESFYDPYTTSFIETDKDPVPYYRYLKENFSSGNLTVPVVGAGTCNSEFEILTGMSCQFLGPGEYPQKTILKKTNCESYADIMNDLGYGTHVTHDNGGNFYSRKNAFSMMGFDTFISKELLDINEMTPLGTWPRDGILLDSTRDAMDSTEGPDYVYTITVETHGDYPTKKVLENPEIKVTTPGKSEEVRYQWEYYINMLYRMDCFMESFTQMLDARGEDTLVVFFGDHLPTMGLSSEEQASGSLFNTGYVTWNNFGMEKKDMDLTTYQLVAEYLNRIDIHGGTILDYNQSKTSAGVEAGSREYMDDLEVLQYDLLYGKKYAYGGAENDPYPPSDIVMGVHPVTIDKIYTYNGNIHIYGSNFTPWSKVYINDEKIPTTYLSGQVLSISTEFVQKGDPIMVGQLGSGGQIFRSSEIVNYEP